jgi:hypothetical protein
MSDTIYAVVILIGLIMLFLIGATYGWLLHQRFIVGRIKTLMSNISNSNDKEVIEINIEKHGDMIYVYDRETKQFMAQGKTREELEKILLEKFPGKRFAAPESQLETGFSK